jgi:hypothetical protein
MTEQTDEIIAPAPSLFDVVKLETIEDLPEPSNGPYFVAASDGYWCMDRNHFGRYLTPAGKDVPLPKAEPMFWYDIPKLPNHIIGQAWSFFRKVYEDRKSEAMVDITWSEEKGYRLFVPPQKASASGVRCERKPEHYKGQMVGTIHSHCNFSAFHSGTDTHDADTHDGLHITIGNVMSDPPSIAIMVSKTKVRWNFKAEDIQETPEVVMASHPAWWEKFVADPDPVQYGQYHTYSKNNNGHKPYTPPQPKKNEIVVVGKAKGTGRSKYGGNGSFMDLDAAVEAAKITDPTVLDRLAIVDQELMILDKVLQEAGIEIDYDFTINPEGPRTTALNPNERLLLGLDDDDLPLEWRNFL